MRSRCSLTCFIASENVSMFPRILIGNPSMSFRKAALSARSLV